MFRKLYLFFPLIFVGHPISNFLTVVVNYYSWTHRTRIVVSLLGWRTKTTICFRSLFFVGHKSDRPYFCLMPILYACTYLLHTHQKYSKQTFVVHLFARSWEKKVFYQNLVGICVKYSREIEILVGAFLWECFQRYSWKLRGYTSVLEVEGLS